ncbi:MAG: hypothetical protein J5614_04680 [Paludibacteraceae bacterium]|nr:hypothetical protein [Paludibacteraceae bacterium]
MGLFDKFKSGTGKPSAFGMIADFLANPQKLKDTLLKQLYPHLAASLIKHLDGIELNEGETQSAIILYKNPKTSDLDYIVATVSEDDRIIRQLEGGVLSEKLDELANKVKLKD